MRLMTGAGYIAGVLLIAGGILTTPAAAQYQNTTTTPLYNAPSGSYQPQGQAGATVPLYNTPSRSAYGQQAIPGGNAPSYIYNNNVAEPYNNFGAATTSSWQSGAPLSPDQVAQIRANRDRQAQQYERQYQQARAADMSRAAQEAGMDPSAYNTLYNNLGAQGAVSTNAQGRERRVIYREENNPLAAPPRLFNMD